MDERISFDRAIVEVLNGDLLSGMPCEDVLAKLLSRVICQDPEAIAEAWRNFSHDECGVPDYLGVAAKIMDQASRQPSQVA
jgi:hypothetical protein